jgi:hypothetical protein
MTLDSMTASMPPHPGSPRQSVFLLVQLAAHATGAAGYSLFEADTTNGSVTRGYSSGSTKSERLSVARYPLCVDGRQTATLVFAFFEHPISEQKRSLLNQMAAVIEAVQALPYITARVAIRIASLDAELADIKIGERARGLLADGASGEAVGTIVRHVEHVLEGRQLGAVFDQLLPDLEDRVEERKLLTKAKVILQESYGMSEEQAYVHLLDRSRSSRKRLRVVAEDLILRTSATSI